MRVAHTRSGKPIPFLLIIFPVVFYFLLIGIGYYVYVVTLCVPLIQDGRIGLGVTLLVIYHITFFLMMWSYAMVIITDPGRVTAEHQLRSQPLPQPAQSSLENQPLHDSPPQQQQEQQQQQQQPQELEQGLQQQQQGMVKDQSAGQTISGSAGTLVPGAQLSNRSGYIHISEDPSAQAHPLWCNKCQHVKPERAHHCRVCKRCVLKMDHHCPWVLNCVGQDNYKFFFLFVFYTAVHCIYILITLAPLFSQTEEKSWRHQQQVIGLVLSGIFGMTLVVFTITHIRLILLNRTTIEDHDTPIEEGILPCLNRAWINNEGDANLGNERLYDLGFRQNWEQVLGKGWRCLLPVRERRPQGELLYNQNVIARQWRDYHAQMELRRQQQQPGYVPEQQQQQQQSGQGASSSSGSAAASASAP